MQPKPTPPAPGTPEYVFKQQADRLTATLGFSRELASGLRKEFARLWQDAPPELDVGDFPARVDELAARVEQALQALALARTRPARDGLPMLAQIELRPVLAAARGLEGAAAKLRQEPALQAWPGAKPAPAPAARGTSELKPSGTGPLTMGTAVDLLKRFVSGLEVKELPAAPPPPPAVPPDFAERRKQLLAALETMGRLLAHVEPRLGVLKSAYAHTGLPSAKKLLADFRAACEAAARAEGASIQETNMRITLGQVLLLNAIAAQRGQVALVQWDEARGLQEEGEVLRQVASGLYSRQAHQALAGFNVGKLRGALIPLNNLPLSFKDVPVLKDLFPLPAQKRVGG